MRYVRNVSCKGIVISPDKEGEPYYDLDGGGIREAIINKENDYYYLNYDAAAPGKTNTSYWNAGQARSKDLIHWEKLGYNMLSSALTHPDGSAEIYKDFCCASSPWSFKEGDKWYHYYIGADHCSPEGIPAFLYSTMLATSDKIDGLWQKKCDESGCEKHVCFPMGKPGTWNDVTTSPGVVIKNPKFANNKEHEKKYLMFYSGACSGNTKRSIGIARSDDLSLTDDFDKENGKFWEKDENPIISPEDDIENSSIYFDEKSKTYYLFTNHIYNNEYTDSVWVYWTKDIDKWSGEDKAIVIDKSVSTWAHGAIGMPTVIKTSDDTLSLLYDAVEGNGTGHLDRSIGLAEIKLPIEIEF